MKYHASYTVNYKSNEMKIKITILRVRCKKCNVSHSLKPDFLASRHQYDTYERQNYVFKYTDISKGKMSLRKLEDKLFPNLLVSHTVMYYWVRVVTVKKETVEPLVASGIQEYIPACDIAGSFFQEVLNIPSSTRDKQYSKDTIIIVNWVTLYLDIISRYTGQTTPECNTSPYIYMNRILETLKSSIFL